MFLNNLTLFKLPQTKKGMIAHTARKVQHLYDLTIFNPFYNELLLIVYRYVDTCFLSDKKPSQLDYQDISAKGALVLSSV